MTIIPVILNKTFILDKVDNADSIGNTGVDGDICVEMAATRKLVHFLSITFYSNKIYGH